MNYNEINLSMVSSIFSKFQKSYDCYILMFKPLSLKRVSTYPYFALHKIHAIFHQFVKEIFLNIIVLIYF